MAMFDKSYHRELKYLHVGCEKPHAYFIPFPSADAARTGDRATSEFFVSLCGEWDFKYYRSVSDIDDIDGDIDNISDTAYKIQKSLSDLNPDQQNKVADLIDEIVRLIK
jgi:hypothetical protein